MFNANSNQDVCIYAAEHRGHSFTTYQQVHSDRVTMELG